MKIGFTKIMLAGFAVLAAGMVFLTHPFATAKPETGKAQTSKADIPKSGLDPTVLKDRALKVIDAYCVTCHGPDQQKGKVRLDALETIDPVDLQELNANAKEKVHLGDMPPAKAKQPTESEREVLLQWLESQLTGEAAKALAEKLQRFEYGNVVKHEDLFSGKYAHLPGYTPDRRWLISEFIFNEKVNGLLDYHPTRTIYGKSYEVAGDSGVHWSPKTERGDSFRRTITNPFLLPKTVGVRYSGHEPITAGHLLTMLGNAKRIAGHMSSESTMKAQYPAMFALMKAEIEQRATLRSREAFLSTYRYLDQLLRDLYGDEHEAMLPKLVRTEVAAPEPLIDRSGALAKRETNLGLLGRLDPLDRQAVYRAIAAYDSNELKVVEIAPTSGGVYQTYSTPTREEYDQIILKAEREWFMEGVSDYRIKNRITTLKLFYVQWDLAGIYNMIKSGGYGAPKYAPLTDVEMAVITGSIKKTRTKGDTYLQIIEKCTADWKASFKAQREAAAETSEAMLGAMIVELYQKVFERELSQPELSKNIALMKSYLNQLETQQAIAKLIESLVLDTEFAYRNEFGAGEADSYGRRMMSPRDMSYALAYALTDSSPDKDLVEAVEADRLSTREDYEREVRRMLARRDVWTIIDESVQAANLNASVTNQPIRKLRFFREFFGYPKAMDVFKDDVRFGAGRHDAAVSRLVDETDMWVEYILQKDAHVFEELLTSDKFYVFHNGDNKSMQHASDELKRMYDRFKDKDWKNLQASDLTPHMDFLKTLFEFQKTKADEKSYLATFKRLMPLLARHFNEGQTNALPYMKVPMGFWHGGPVVGRTGQQMRAEEVTSYWNIDWRTWDYPTQQPAKIPNRKGILTHPAWLIAHAQNLETDPIHRGKWIREKLLAGTIPDVPITVDAVIPEDHTRTLRQRMQDRTGEAYCWRCHQKMDPLGLPFEIYDDFGRYRTEENLEHPDNLIKPAPKQYSTEELTFGANLPVYKTLPVDARGVLNGTDDSSLDGEVKDAFDLIDRLAKSAKVRQSIIRHAFRYFMGRNEMLSDSKTLMDADRAYLDSNGSFDEVIVSLLTSDSFIYRKPPTKDE